MSSYGLQDHIAITSGDKSTTLREVSARDAQLLLASASLRVILAILFVASGEIRKYCPATQASPPNTHDRWLRARSLLW